MYLISAYFDETSSRILSGYRNRIAEKTGNRFMTEHQVPPHLTISAVEARGESVLLPHFEKAGRDLCDLTDDLDKEKIVCQDIFFVSVGVFFPNVIHVAPVLNASLFRLSEWVYRIFCDIPEVRISRLYQPFHWFPHVTLGKTLSKEEMKAAFEVMQNGFAPFEGKIVSIGLAKVNPHEDISMIEL